MNVAVVGSGKLEKMTAAILQQLKTQAARLTGGWLLVVAASLMAVGAGTPPRITPVANGGPEALRAVTAPYGHAAVTNTGWLLPFGVLGTATGGSWSRYGHSNSPADGTRADAPLTKPDETAALAARAQLRGNTHGRYGSRATTIPPPTH